MKINGRFILFTVLLVILTTLCKFFFGPDLEMSGFSPVIAIALFSGMIIKEKGQSFLLPLLALLLSDVAIQVLYSLNLFEYPGFYGGQWKNYLILLVSTLIGWRLRGRSFATLAVGAITAPTVFFLLSNFGVWMGVTDGTYSRDLNGLMACYAAGLPFYKNALLATLLFLPMILFTYNWLVRQKTQLTLA